MDESPLDEFAALVASGEGTLDLTERRAYRAALLVELTAKEANCLWYIVAGTTSSSAGLDRVWDQKADPFTATRRLTIMTLRRKIIELGGGDSAPGGR